MKSGTHFLLIWTICFFSFYAFAGKKEIQAEIASIVLVLELCASNEDDSDETKKQAEECKQSYLLVLEQLQAKLAKIGEIEKLQTALAVNTVELTKQQEALLYYKKTALKKTIQEAEMKIESLNRRHTELLDQHNQNLEDDEEYTPNQYEDANELLRLRDIAIQMRNIAEEELAALVQETPANESNADIGTAQPEPFFKPDASFGGARSS